MSFGFGIGDITAMASLAHRVYTAYREAPGELRHLSHELLSLHSVLEALRLDLEDPDSAISRSGDLKIRDLKQLIAHYNGPLRELEAIYKKYQGSDEPWRKVVFSKENLDGIRQKLVVHLRALEVFLAIISQSSLTRIEKRVEEMNALLKAGGSPANKKQVSGVRKAIASTSDSATSKKPAESTAGSSGLSKPKSLSSEKKLSPERKPTAKKTPSASATSKEPAESTVGSSGLSKPKSLPSEKKLSPEQKSTAKKTPSASAASKKPAESITDSSGLSKPNRLPSEKKLSPKQRPAAKKTPKAVKFAGSPRPNGAPAAPSKNLKKNSAETPKTDGEADSPGPKRGPDTASSKVVPKVQTPNSGSKKRPAPKIRNSTTPEIQPPASPRAETAQSTSQSTPQIKAGNLPYAPPDFLRGLITVEAPVTTGQKRNASPSARTGRVTLLGYTHAL